MFDLLITGGTMVSPEGCNALQDVGIRGGIVAAVGSDLPREAGQIIDASGCMVLPGVIDLHTHLRATVPAPALFLGETASAVAGGVTLIGDFAYPSGTRYEMDFSTKKERLEQEALCDFCLHTVVRAPEHLEQAETWSIKVFFSASGLGAQAGNALSLLHAALEEGHLVLAHVERMDDYQAIVADVTKMDFPGRVHILHVPHEQYVAAVRASGEARITLETCPHYLLWERTMDRESCNVNPAIVANSLWPMLLDGGIDTLGTDHCSYTRSEKDAYNLPGFPCVDAMLRLIYTHGVQTGRITWADLVRLTSAGPARVLGLYPRKGSLQVGSDADLVIFDPTFSGSLTAPAFGRGDFSPYAGMRLMGRVVSTLVRGRKVFSDGAIDSSAAGWGLWQDRGLARS